MFQLAGGIPMGQYLTTEEIPAVEKSASELATTIRALPKGTVKRDRAADARATIRVIIDRTVAKIKNDTLTWGQKNAATSTLLRLVTLYGKNHLGGDKELTRAMILDFYDEINKATDAVFPTTARYRHDNARYDNAKR